jgi:uncharacterized protein (TIGR02001 family)
MRLSQCVAAVLLLASGAVAHAEVTGTVTAVSDYDFRGISLSATDPALQGSIDWAGESGFYLGAWASNIDYGDDVDGDVEIDLYAGFASETEAGLGWDVGLVYYTYPGADDISDYPEIYGALSYKWFELKQWYSNDLSGSDEDGFYTEGNASFELPAGFGLNLHLGYNYGDAFDSPDPAFKDSEYMDYAIGVAYTLSHFDLELKWVDNDMDNDAYFYTEDDPFNTEGRVIFSVSTTFPWSAKEE